MYLKSIPRCIIDLVNIKLKVQDDQAVFTENVLKKFENIKEGIPLLIPAHKKIFIFNRDDTFNLSPRRVLNTVYNLEDKNYIGFRTSFEKFIFLSRFKLKPSYHEVFNFVYQYNLDAINKIRNLKNIHNSLGAFQTRNIPHFGHEKIIETMLDRCDHLVINPVIGPKKKGDVLIENLDYVFSNILSKKFYSKISFIPIFANMFYAGPREAVHHAKLRTKLGFTHFSVGRDHAGAHNAYDPYLAPSLIDALKEEFEINVITHDGAYYCKKCCKVVLKGHCNHNKKFLEDISGSSFRDYLQRSQIYKFADKKVQSYIIKNKEHIFQ